MQIITLHHNTLLAQIAPNIGNTLFSLKYQNQEKLYFPYTLDEYQSSPKLAGNPFMHPWANRLEDKYITLGNGKHHFPKNTLNKLYRDGNQLPLHGLLLKSDKWQTLEHTPLKHVAHFHFSDAEELAIFPFEHTITIAHELTAENEIAISTTLHNLAPSEMPASFGFHPYFLLNEKRENTTLKIPASSVLDTDEKQIPNDNKHNKNKQWQFDGNSIVLNQNTFDHGFTDLQKNDNNETVFSINNTQIIFDSQYPFAQIYAPLHPEKPYVCIEPMTAATNALNRASCTHIAKDELFKATFKIRLLS